MSFTIEVKKKGKDEDFDLEGLEMFHRDCDGGQIEVKGTGLICKRCGIEANLPWDIETAKAQIVLTAIDGQQREIKSRYDWLPDITVMQRP